MKEIFLLKLGEIVLKGANKRQFESRLRQNVRRRMKKYGNFDISSGLKVSYRTDDGEERTVDFLSGGTRDLAYISVRMALIDMLYTEKPPICLDESFAHQDNVRAKSMMKSLAHLSKEGYQSFIFTCRAREAALASELVKKAGIYKLSVVED